MGYNRFKLARQKVNLPYIFYQKKNFIASGGEQSFRVSDEPVHRKCFAILCSTEIENSYEVLPTKFGLWVVPFAISPSW